MDENTDSSSLTINEILDDLKLSDSLSIPMLYRLTDLGPSEISEFCGTWSSIDSERRRVIVRHLADISEENFEVDFTDVFAHCLDDDSPEVRKASLDGLWDSERATLIRPIIDLMEGDSDAGVRVLAAATLGHYVLLGEWRQIPERTVEPIVESLFNQIESRHTKELVRYAALESVAASGNPRVESLIHKAYDSADLSAQKSALFAMGRSANTRWINIVIDEMSSPIVELRAEAARAAGEIGHRSAIPELIELTSDEDLEVRMVAVSALGRIGGDISRQYLQEMVEDFDDEELSEAASNALEEMDWFGGEIDLSLGEL